MIYEAKVLGASAVLLICSLLSPGQLAEYLGICGELGADLALTELFLRMGVDELSVSPSAILPLRRRIRGLDLRLPPNS